MFLAQLKDIRLQLARFLPYNTILPALTSMAQALSITDDIFKLCLINKRPTIFNNKDAVTSVGDLKRQPKSEKAVAGFDELNLIGGEEGAAGAIGRDCNAPDCGNRSGRAFGGRNRANG